MTIDDITYPPIDLRRNAARPDRADVRLKEFYPADTYVAGEPCQVRAPTLPMKKNTEHVAGLENEVLFGEAVTVFDEKDGWAWVQLQRDKYVGYVPAQGLSRESIPATHRVASIGTFIYPEPNIKTVPLAHLSLNATVAVRETNDRFATLATGGYLIARHLRDIDRNARDFVDIAERLIGTPYLWGGRTRLGFDCSGLVQLAMEAAGLDCPRDTDMQSAEVGTPIVADASYDNLVRGDLVFWPGHVGIMIDGVMLLHANGHHMSTVVEPLSQAVTRIARDAGERGQVSMIKRPHERGKLRVTSEVTI
jgi:cell wall-associated NlpC family hydrolase